MELLRNARSGELEFRRKAAGANSESRGAESESRAGRSREGLRLDIGASIARFGALAYLLRRRAEARSSPRIPFS